MNNNDLSQTDIEAIGLGKVYWDGDRALEIFKNVSFKIKKGEGVAVFGPSGSGKTTLLNLLSGLDKASEGDVKIHGRALRLFSEAELSEFRNKTVGFIFQFYHLLSEFTALENVMLPAKISKTKNSTTSLKDRARALLERVGMAHRLKHYPSELSGGEQQRVAMARALMNNPSVLFCDEPTGNLDKEMGAQVIEILKELFIKEKKTVIMVTHDERIAKIAERVWDMDKRGWVS